MTDNDPDYERQTRSLLEYQLPEHAVVEALLGIAHELRAAANRPAPDRALRLRRPESDIELRANLENVRRRTGEAPEPLRDPQGRVWPVTGYWCDACGMPLHRTLRAVGVHPACDNSLTGPQ